MNDGWLFVEKYIQLYPQDTVVIGGGAAAYLILKEYNIHIPLRGIDVNIETKATEEEVVARWFGMTPKTYRIEGSWGIYTITDTTERNIPINLFINECDIKQTEKIGSFTVIALDDLILEHERFLMKMRRFLQCRRKESISWYEQEFDRTAHRVSLLNKIRKMRE